MKKTSISNKNNLRNYYILILFYVNVIKQTALFIVYVYYFHTTGSCPWHGMHTAFVSLRLLQQGRLVLKITEWRHRIILPKPSAMFLPVYVHTQALCYYHSIRERPPCLQAKWKFQSLCFRTSTIFQEKEKSPGTDRISPDVRREEVLSLWLLLFLALSASSLARVSTSVSRQQCCLSQHANPDWMTDCAKTTHAHAHAHTQQLGEALYKLGQWDWIKDVTLKCKVSVMICAGVAWLSLALVCSFSAARSPFVLTQWNVIPIRTINRSKVLWLSSRSVKMSKPNTTDTNYWTSVLGTQFRLFANLKCDQSAVTVQWVRSGNRWG